MINRGFRPSFCARGPPENAGRRASRGDQPGKQMRTSGKILDDLLRKVLTKLLASTNQITTSRGPAREITGVLLELERPLARLSRSETRGRPFSSLGEFFWYLSRDNKLDFIRYYIPDYDNETEDGETIYGGYGPRIFRQRCRIRCGMWSRSYGTIQHQGER